MNVLMIGLDPTLAIDNGAENSKNRHITYGKYLSKLIIITKVPKKVNTKKLSENVIVHPVSSKNILFFIFKSFKISEKICKLEKIDIIMTQDPIFTGIVGYTISKRYKIPLIVQLHGDFLDNKHWLNRSFINRVLNTIGKYILKKSNGVRVVSRRLEKYAKKVCTNIVFNIPIYNDLERFEKCNTTLDKHNLTKYRNKKIILFVGRLAPEKNVPALIKALAIVVKKYPNTVLMIVGDGPERKKLEKLVAKLELENNVVFIGAVKPDKVVNYYGLCDTLVLPSNFEGWGRVVVEACACGKPVIMTDVGCAGEVIINGKSGLVVPVGNVEALAEKLIYLINNVSIAKKMGKTGKKIVIKHNIEETAKKIAKMCKVVANESSHGHSKN